MVEFNTLHTKSHSVCNNSIRRPLTFAWWRRTYFFPDIMCYVSRVDESAAEFRAIQSSFDSQLVPKMIITTRMSFVCEPEHASRFSLLFGEITSDTSKNYIVEYNRRIWALEQHHDTLKAAARKNFHHFKHWNCFVHSQCRIVCIRKVSSSERNSIYEQVESFWVEM